MIGFPGAKVPLLLALVIFLSVLVACGSTGLSGAQGVQGPQGSQGMQGAQGMQGPQGAQASLLSANEVLGIVQPMATDMIPQLMGPQGAQGPPGLTGPTGGPGPNAIQQSGLTLDKAVYVQGVDTDITVYGSGFGREEFVLPQIMGANPRGFKAVGTNADMYGAFSTTITMDDLVTPGVYTLRVGGGEGNLMTVPLVVVESAG